MLKHGDYFYACGTYGSMGDSYTIRCCRQAASHPNAPRGPYTDKEGATCSEFSQTQNRYPASMLLGPDGDHLVPGHPHFWQEADGALFLGYDYRDQLPSVKEDAMAVRRLHFDAEDWPTVCILSALHYAVNGGHGNDGCVRVRRCRAPLCVRSGPVHKLTESGE